MATTVNRLPAAGTPEALLPELRDLARDHIYTDFMPTNRIATSVSVFRLRRMALLLREFTGRLGNDRRGYCARWQSRLVVDIHFVIVFVALEAFLHRFWKRIPLYATLVAHNILSDMITTATTEAWATREDLIARIEQELKR